MIHDLVHNQMPDASLLLLLVFTLPITPICVYLVFHQDYEDGFFGRIGLSLIGVAAFVRFVSIFSDAPPITPVGLTLWAGVSIFLARHAWRFAHRNALWKNAPHPADPQQTAGKKSSTAPLIASDANFEKGD